MKKKIKEYIMELRENNYSENTIVCYQNLLNKINFNASASDIKMAIIHDQSVKSASTIEFRKRVIISFMKWLKDNRWQDINLVKTPTQQKRHFKIVSDEQMNEIWEHDSSEDDHIALRNKLVFLTLFNTGLRVSELLNVKIKDVNQEESSIIIRGKGNKWRTIYINKSLLSLILSLEGDTYLFETNQNKKMSYKTIYSIFDKIKDDIGLSHDLTLHSFRRTFCTNLINNGMNIKIVSELMGHSKISTTSNYISITSDEIKEKFIMYNNCLTGL